MPLLLSPLLHDVGHILSHFARGTARTEVWRGLQGAMTLQAAIGKFVIAIDEDIDPENPDARKVLQENQNSLAEANQYRSVLEYLR